MKLDLTIICYITFKKLLDPLGYSVITPLVQALTASTKQKKMFTNHQDVFLFTIFTFHNKIFNPAICF